VRGIVGCDSVPQLFLPRRIELWEAGRFPAERIMIHDDFDAIDQAARDAEAGRVIKPMLRMGTA
jgi:aryl-alcohol dehydrogenase